MSLDRPRRSLMHRLAVFMVGVGIGLMLLGLIHRGRTATLARRNAQQTVAPVPIDASSATQAEPIQPLGGDSDSDMPTNTP
jgi:hypothetical protein